MPIYEYECQKCKAHTEAFQKITDKPLVKCSKCGGRLEKQISASAIQFKGSGWYVTDYAAKSGKPSEKADGDTTKDDKSATKKTDKQSKESAATPQSSPKSASPKATD